MPGFDKTGPQGKGSKTGRGQGTCGSNNPEPENEQDTQGFGRYFRRLRTGRKGSGLGKRFRHGQQK